MPRFAAFKEDLPDVTTIMIAQRISSIQHADRIIVIHEGNIESIGSHDELMENLQSIERYMNHSRKE